MGANDEMQHPWIPSECLLLRKCTEKELPVVGICLGGQLLAKALGAVVEQNPHAEVGWFPVTPNARGLEDPVMGAAGGHPIVYHWHQDTFHLPGGAELLAHSRLCERQAYKIGDFAYGFQFHPEADAQLVAEWLAIESCGDEIQATQKKHGPSGVQGQSVQGNFSKKGERGSLKITAALSRIFRQVPLGEPLKDVELALPQYTVQRKRICIEFHDSSRRTRQILGVVINLLRIPAGEFVVFRAENGLLWPIPMGDVLAVKS